MHTPVMGRLWCGLILVFQDRADCAAKAKIHLRGTKGLKEAAERHHRNNAPIKIIIHAPLFVWLQGFKTYKVAQSNEKAEKTTWRSSSKGATDQSELSNSILLWKTGGKEKNKTVFLFRELWHGKTEMNTIFSPRRKDAAGNSCYWNAVKHFNLSFEYVTNKFQWMLMRRWQHQWQTQLQFGINQRQKLLFTVAK